MKSTNRAARTKDAQAKAAKVAYDVASTAAIKDLIEKSKQQPEPTPVPQPQVKTIAYIFGDGSVVTGTPTTLQLVQDGDNIVAINILKREGDKVSYSPVATFVGLRMQRVEAQPSQPASEAAAAIRTVSAPTTNSKASASAD